MAKFDWETSLDALNAVLLGLTGAEKVVTQALIDRLEAVGVPYNAVYTGEVDTTKASDVAENTAETAAWLAEMTTVYQDVSKAILYAEEEVGIESAALPTFDVDNLYFKSDVLARFTYVATSITERSLSAVFADYRSQFLLAYGLRPKDTYSGLYGVTKSVVVSSEEVYSPQEAEVILAELVDKAAELLDELAYTP